MFFLPKEKAKAFLFKNQTYLSRGFLTQILVLLFYYSKFFSIFTAIVVKT